MKSSVHSSRALRTGLFLSLASAGLSHGAVLYTISSFDPTDAAASSSTTVQYVPGLVAITTVAGLTGTTATQLNNLQTINANASTGLAGSRFQNSDRDVNQTNGTLISDTAGFFQFGVSGGMSAITLTNLTFNAKRATGDATSVRGYNITASVNGGAYNALGSGNLSADRSAAPFNTVPLLLTGAQYQNISSIDFRVASTGGGIEYANFTLNGAVPEPSSALLFVLSASSILTLRRRR